MARTNTLTYYENPLITARNKFDSTGPRHQWHPYREITAKKTSLKKLPWTNCNVSDEEGSLIRLTPGRMAEPQACDEPRDKKIHVRKPPRECFKLGRFEAEKKMYSLRARSHLKLKTRSN